MEQKLVRMIQIDRFCNMGTPFHRAVRDIRAEPVHACRTFAGAETQNAESGFAGAVLTQQNGAVFSAAFENEIRKRA